MSAAAAAHSDSLFPDRSISCIRHPLTRSLDGNQILVLLSSSSSFPQESASLIMRCAKAAYHADEDVDEAINNIIIIRASPFFP